MTTHTQENSDDGSNSPPFSDGYLFEALAKGRDTEFVTNWDLNTMQDVSMEHHAFFARLAGPLSIDLCLSLDLSLLLSPWLTRSYTIFRVECK